MTGKDAVAIVETISAHQMKKAWFIAIVPLTDTESVTLNALNIGAEGGRKTANGTKKGKTMTDREKLVELLKHIPQVNQYEAQVQCLDYVYGCAADYLLANGVTIPVRCKECRHYNEDGEYCGNWGECRHPEHFCDEGLRKDNES